MQRRVLGILATFLVLASLRISAQEIPGGTVLPVMLRSTLDARHDKPGRAIAGRIMQDVPLPDGANIPRGTRITGRVVSANSATAGSPSRLTVKFDGIVVAGRELAITTHLRALASMNEVFEAKLPTNSIDDYGTSPSDWNTVQVGGAGVFRGSGEVVADGQVVGRTTDYGAVTAKLVAAPQAGCHADEEGRGQALWVFSPSACGLYGLSDLRIAHAGSTDPVGEIALQSSRDVHVSGGSGWLLRVDSSEAESPSSK